MTKKILLSAVVALFTFSGCLSTDSAKPATQKATKAIDKAENNATKATNKATKAIDKAKSVTSKVESEASKAEATPPPESSLKDQAIEKAVEVTDEHTDGAATKVIESVK